MKYTQIIKGCLGDSKVTQEIKNKKQLDKFLSDTQYLADFHKKIHPTPTIYVYSENGEHIKQFL